MALVASFDLICSSRSLMLAYDWEVSSLLQVREHVGSVWEGSNTLQINI